MKAVVWHGVRDVRYEEIPEPEPKAGEVKLKVAACGYCVTDYHLMTGYLTLCQPPHVLGHEICGRVEQVGEGVDASLLGRRAVVETYVGCGSCEFCKTGRQHLCEAGEIGYPPYQGGEAEYVCVPAHCLHFLPDAVTDEEAGIMEAVVCPFGAILSSNVRGKTVLVYGAGVAGLSFIQSAKYFGASKVLCVVRSSAKEAQAKKFGADVVINSGNEDVTARVMAETEGYGADFFADGTGSLSVIENSFRLIKKGGTLILYGLPEQQSRLQLPIFDVILNQITVVGYTGNSEAWEQVIAATAAGEINLSDLVSEVLPLSEVSKAIDRLDHKPADMIKIVLLPQKR